MAEWLAMAKQERDQKWPDCPWVFSRRGRQIGDFRKVWESACTRAGVPGLLLHDLRRSAVRNMERAGIPRNVAMSISGHRTEAIYRRYDIVSGRDLLNAAAKLESFLDSQTPRLSSSKATKKDEESPEGASQASPVN
jgi:integrase